MDYLSDNKTNETDVYDIVPLWMRFETYAVSILFSIIFVVGIVGNWTVCAIFIRHSSMRNVPNTYGFDMQINGSGNRVTRWQKIWIRFMRRQMIRLIIKCDDVPASSHARVDQICMKITWGSAGKRAELSFKYQCRVKGENFHSEILICALEWRL